jgi:hypothetical protein
MDIKPSQLKSWDEIDQSQANIECCADKHPEWYNWFEIDKVWYPHRKPTITEIQNDEFH